VVVKKNCQEEEEEKAERQARGEALKKLEEIIAIFKENR
jgi:hypothetical protein